MMLMSTLSRRALLVRSLQRQLRWHDTRQPPALWPIMTFARPMTSNTGDALKGKPRDKNNTTTNHASNRSKVMKRPKMKQARVTPDEPNLFDGDGVCAAYCVNNAVSLNHITKQIKSTNFKARKRGIHLRYQTHDVKKLYPDVVHLTLRSVGRGGGNIGTDDEDNQKDTEYDVEDEDGHIFLFGSGAFVLWGVPLDIRRQIFELMLKCQHYDMHDSNAQKNEHQLDMKHFEHEFKFSILDNYQHSTFRNDEIVIASSSDDYMSNLLACSYGLAQSVRLLIYEEVVDSLIVRTQRLPNELAQHGHVNLSHRDLKRLIGELLAAKYSLNLVSDILDTPEYFWSHPDLERLHVECTTQVELKQRSKILDARTEVIKDALAILNNELSSSSSDRVERAILFLIGVEVAIEVVKALQP